MPTPVPEVLHRQALGLLAERGIVRADELQRALGRSQPTVSRTLAALSGRVLRLGRARATRYGLPKSIHGLSSQQPLRWTDTDGRSRRIGTLSLLERDWVHVESDLVDDLEQGRLPWFLAPLHAQGFIGRLIARRLERAGIDANPDAWNVETALFAATHLHDAPGAISVGDGPTGAESALRPAAPLADAALRAAPLPTAPKRLAAALDALAVDVARTLPAGSSAAGEQPKFLARIGDDDASAVHAIVKFSPPRGTPFGERWNDLLHAEALAAEVLGEHGVRVAASRIVRSASRTYLVVERFDRVGARGRRHAVSVGDVHRAFVAGTYSNWARSCEQLVRQRRLPPGDGTRVAALVEFGRLIGNTDMHPGNLALLVDPQDIARGRFALAPLYDMLPMRWRPDPVTGGMADYAPFEPDAVAVEGVAAPVAARFWGRLAGVERIDRRLRDVAREMRRRIAA